MIGALQRYLKQVAANMDLNRLQRKCLFTKIREELEEQLEDQNISSFADIVNVLGNPEDFAGQLSEVEPFVCEVVAVKRSRNRLMWAVIIIAAIMAFLVVICVWLALTQPGYYVVE